MVRQDCTALTLLDLSATYYTIDHHIILDRLNEWFGLGVNALKLKVSYIKHGFKLAQILSIKSKPIELIFRVPHGSVISFFDDTYLYLKT